MWTHHVCLFLLNMFKPWILDYLLDGYSFFLSFVKHQDEQIFSLFTYFFPMWFLKIDLFLFYCTDSLSHLILFERVESDQKHTNDDAAAPHIAVTWKIAQKNLRGHVINGPYYTRFISKCIVNWTGKSKIDNLNDFPLIELSWVCALSLVDKHNIL